MIEIEADDRQLMEAVLSSASRKGAAWAALWDVEAALDLSASRVRARAARLIARGLLEGCTDGCRGDFIVTDRGMAALPLQPLQGAQRRLAASSTGRWIGRCFGSISQLSGRPPRVTWVMPHGAISLCRSRR